MACLPVKGSGFCDVAVGSQIAGGFPPNEQPARLGKWKPLLWIEREILIFFLE